MSILIGLLVMILSIPDGSTTGWAIYVIGLWITTRNFFN